MYLQLFSNRYITKRDSYVGHEDATRVHNTTLGRIVIEVMMAIWEVFVDIHMPFPNPDIIKKSAKNFWLNYGFPMVWGALDGKHFPIKNPEDGSKANFCYKRFYSLNVQG